MPSQRVQKTISLWWHRIINMTINYLALLEHKNTGWGKDGGPVDTKKIFSLYKHELDGEFLPKQRTLGIKRKSLLKFKHWGKGEQRRNLSQDPGLGLSGVRLSRRWWTGQRGREKGWLYAGAAGNPLTPPRVARGETTFPGTEGCLLLHSRVGNATFWGEVLPAKFGYLLSLAISRWVSLLFKYHSFPSSSQLWVWKPNKIKKPKRTKT